MRVRLILAVMILVFLLAGCQGATRAHYSLEKGMRANLDVRTAFFVKAWGLNRALITEAREKWIGEAANDILDGSQDGKIETSRAMEVLAKLNQDIGQDEAVISESFAYLAFLLVAGERADQYLHQADGFLESRKPIWNHLSQDSYETTHDILDEVRRWKPLIQDIEKMIPKSLAQSSQE